MVVSVKHRHDRSFADSAQFVVNGDYDSPSWLMRAIVRAKVEAMEAMFDNRPGVSFITSNVTGEILYRVSYDWGLRAVLITGRDMIADFSGVYNG